MKQSAQQEPGGDPMGNKHGLAWLARRTSGNPAFMGHALEQYRVAHGHDARAMRKLLDCTPAALVRLALCKRPNPESGRYVQDVNQIARYAPCNPDWLLYILREADAPSDDAPLYSYGEADSGLSYAAKARDE